MTAMQRRCPIAAWLGLVLLSLPLGCKDEGGSGGPVQYDEIVDAEVDALCDYFVRCGLATDAALCVDAWSRFTRLPADLDAAIANGTVQYDAAAAGECLDGLRGATCDGLFDVAVFDQEACERVFTGTIGNGDPCFIDEQCIEGLCDVDACAMACCEGTCIAAPPQAAIGEDCSLGQDCVPGAYCDVETEVCAAYRVQGEACPGGYECGGGLECISAICQPGPGEGEDCLELQCAQPLACDIDSMTCQRLRGEGQACNPLASICAMGLVCNGSSNTCARPGGVGSPCNFDFIGFGCSGDSYCDYDFEAGEGTCQPLVANGGTCDDDLSCESRYCGQEGMCEPEPVCVQ